MNEIVHIGMAKEGEDDDELLAAMRENGVSKIDSIKILTQVKGFGLGKAKEIVHYSYVWQDLAQRDDKFHNDVVKALELDGR